MKRPLQKFSVQRCGTVTTALDASNGNTVRSQWDEVQQNNSSVARVATAHRYTCTLALTVHETAMYVCVHVDAGE